MRRTIMRGAVQWKVQGSTYSVTILSASCMSGITLPVTSGKGASAWRNTVSLGGSQGQPTALPHSWYQCALLVPCFIVPMLSWVVVMVMCD